MSVARFLWSPGDEAAGGGRIGPAVAALVVTALAQGAAMRMLLDRPEFPSGGGPELGATWRVATEIAIVSVAAWFMRTTLLEIALDFRRKQRNMRPLLRATAWIGAGAAALATLWILAMVALLPQKAPPPPPPGHPEQMQTSPNVWIMLVPVWIAWLARAAWDGLAAARLYAKPRALAVPLSFVFGLVSLIVAFVAICFVNAGFLRIGDAFRQ